MKFLESFSQEHITEVLKNSLQNDNNSKFLLSVEKCNYNENFTLLNVDVDGVKQNYVLVTVPEDLRTKEYQPLKLPNVLYPVFIIEDNNKQTYGAFEKNELKNFVLPKENTTEYLKIILKNLAENQALELANNKKDQPQKLSEYKLEDITDVVTSLDSFRDLKQPIVKNTIDDLQLAFNKLFDDPNLLVTSIANGSVNNVYLNLDDRKSTFLNVSSKKVVPPVYDALVYIFKLTNEKFRQEHFENLVLYYFESLKQFLQKLQSSAADKITRRYEEGLVKVLLPVVKFQIINSLLQLGKPQKLNEILVNVRHFLQYPYVNQEDIYEVVNNKLESCNYQLLDYDLRSLSSKNGHLGEYFHLDIKIKFDGKETELQLFAKFLKAPSELEQGFVENGPAKKEDFFYRIFLPLCKELGLDNLLDFAPRCYLSKINWLLVLDDLSRQGYVGFKPNVLLNYKELRVSVETLAKFHACSIILEEIFSNQLGKTVRLDDDYAEFLEEKLLIYEDGNPIKQHYDAVLNIFYYIAEKCPEVLKKLNLSSEEIRERIKDFFLSLFSKVRKSNLIRNVINHGDMYVANMLFKFGEDKLVANGILVDFQMLRYSSPSLDLLFFLYSNSTKETRDKYLEVLIEDYYRCFSSYLRKFKVDPEIVFPKDTFVENVRFLKPAGVAGGLNYAHLTQVDSDFREELMNNPEKAHYYLMNHKEELIDLFWDTEQYRNVLRGLIEDMVDLIKNSSST